MRTPLVVEDWGVCAYETAFQRQAQLVAEHLQGRGRDTLVLVEHPATVTFGRRGSEKDLRCPAEDLSGVGIEIHQINRGGLATAHEPGQLVAYPIVALKRKDVRWFSGTFLNVIVQLLADHGLMAELKEREPGVWVRKQKICSFGIALKKWISSHGIALNVNNDLATFAMIIPCGQPREALTSVSKELGYKVNMKELKGRFTELFLNAFDYEAEPPADGGQNEVS